MAAKACPTQPQTHTEQVIYANLLEKGMYLGLLTLLVTFAIYTLGILPSAIPMSEIEKYWSMNAHDYLEAINANFLHNEHPPTGWAWLGLVAKGDFLNFIGIAILSGVTILCYAAIIPTLLARKDTAYVLMSIAEIAVLGLAASGILAVGGH